MAGTSPGRCQLLAFAARLDTAPMIRWPDSHPIARSKTSVTCMWTAPCRRSTLRCRCGIPRRVRQCICRRRA